MKHTRIKIFNKQRKSSADYEKEINDFINIHDVITIISHDKAIVVQYKETY